MASLLPHLLSFFLLFFQPVPPHFFPRSSCYDTFSSTVLFFFFIFRRAFFFPSLPLLPYFFPAGGKIQHPEKKNYMLRSIKRQDGASEFENGGGRKKLINGTAED